MILIAGSPFPTNHEQADKGHHRREQVRQRPSPRVAGAESPQSRPLPKPPRDNGPRPDGQATRLTYYSKQMGQLRTDACSRPAITAPPGSNGPTMISYDGFLAYSVSWYAFSGLLVLLFR